MTIVIIIATLLFGGIVLPAQTAKSGITGVVVQMGHAGPTRADEPPQYYSGPLDVVRISDQERVASTNSDRNGKFTVAVPPGKYNIIQSDRRYSRIQSEEILVEKDKLTVVKIYADNGMR